MTDELTLDDLDSVVVEPDAPPKPERKSNLAIQNAIVNVDVAKRLAAGESPRALAIELGVSEQTIRKKMRRADMQDLLAIEARRAMRSISRRKLSRVPYDKLAKTAVMMIDANERLKNDGLGKESRVIDQTFIGQLNILLQRPGSESQSLPDIRNITENVSYEIPDIPEDFEQGSEGESSDIDGSCSSE